VESGDAVEEACRAAGGFGVAAPDLARFEVFGDGDVGFEIGVGVEDGDEGVDRAGEEAGGGEAGTQCRGVADGGDLSLDQGRCHPRGEEVEGGLEGVGDIFEGLVGIGEGVEEASEGFGAGSEDCLGVFGHSVKIVRHLIGMSSTLLEILQVLVCEMVPGIFRG